MLIVFCRIFKVVLEICMIRVMLFTMITRDIQKELLVCAKEYPAVTILGPRQSGKTTLSKMAFPDHAYCSLEEPDTRREAKNDPKGLLANFSGGVILDEIQRVPELLRGCK